jgi:hypothetical protein
MEDGILNETIFNRKGAGPLRFFALRSSVFAV